MLLVAPREVELVLHALGRYKTSSLAELETDRQPDSFKISSSSESPLRHRLLELKARVASWVPGFWQESQRI